MSDLQLECPHCSQSLEASDDMAGEIVECPNCNGSIQLPNPSTCKKQAPQPHPKLQIKKGTVVPPSARPPAPRQQSMPTQLKACPYCAEPIQLTAIRCKHCNADLRSNETLDGGLVVGGWVTAFLMPLVGFILGIVILAKGKRIGHGIAILIISLTMFGFWAAFWPSFWGAFWGSF